jgi:hypothetical protein
LLSRATWIQSTPSCPIFLRSMLIVSSRLRLRFRLSNQILHVFLTLDLINLILYNWRSNVYPFTPLRPKYPLNHPFLKRLYVVRDKILGP